MFEGFACAGERQHFGYHRLKLPPIDQCADLIQLPSITTHDEKYAAHAVLLSFAGRNRRNQRYQDASFPKHAPGTPTRFTTDSVKYHIDVSQRILEAHIAVLDDNIGSEAMHERCVARRRRGHYAGALPTCQLHCQGPDTAGSAVDQDALSGGKVRMFEERLPGCQRRKRQRRGLCVRDAARLQSQIDRPHCRELSSRSVTRKISKSIDLVADPKISYISRHPLHRPRNLMAQDARDPWRPVRVLIGLVPSQFRGRDASGAHPHQHIPTSDLRQWGILEKYLLRSARP